MRTETALKEILVGVRELLSRKDREDGFIDIKRASAFAGLGVDVIRGLIRDGRLKGFQPNENGKILIKRRDLVELIESAEIHIDDRAEKMWKRLAK